MSVRVWPPSFVHTGSAPTSHCITPPASYLLLFMRGAEPPSPRSLISVFIMLPGNNTHFISSSFTPPPSPPPCPLSNVYLINSFLRTFPAFVSPRLAVVSDLRGSPGSYEREADAPPARELHHTSGPARCGVIGALIFENSQTTIFRIVNA